MPAPYSDQRLEQLLQVTAFPPPAGFAARATAADPAVYEQASADPQAWWAGQARQRLTWDTPFTEVLDDTTRRSTGGSPMARSTSRTTAWTGTSWPGTATGWHSTGTARKASSAI